MEHVVVPDFVLRLQWLYVGTWTQTTFVSHTGIRTTAKTCADMPRPMDRIPLLFICSKALEGSEARFNVREIADLSEQAGRPDLWNDPEAAQKVNSRLSHAQGDLRRVEDAREHIASLRRVLALEPQLLICDHAGILEHAEERLSRKIRFWEDLAGQARELRGQGLSSAEIAHRLLGRDGFLAWASFGDFSHRNLIESLLAAPAGGDVPGPPP